MNTPRKDKHFVRIQPSGCTFHRTTINMQSKKPQVNRGKCAGWTIGSSQRLTRWLMSVDTRGMESAEGWGVTLTYPHMPDPDDYKADKKALIRYIDVRVDRYLWIVEWTRRGRPHLHLYVDGMGGHAGYKVVDWWLSRVEGTHLKAQWAEEAFSVDGWLKYNAKHARRGTWNYQRVAGYLPNGWDNTGRMWGYGGAWHNVSGRLVEISESEYNELKDIYVASLQAKFPENEIREAAFTFGFNVWTDQAKAMFGDRLDLSMVGPDHWDYVNDWESIKARLRQDHPKSESVDLFNAVDDGLDNVERLAKYLSGRKRID